MKKKFGSREEVFKGIAAKTIGGLKKEDLKEKQIGKKVKYVSRKKSARMQKNNPFNKKKKVSFKLNNNKTKEYYCKDIDNDFLNTTYFKNNDTIIDNNNDIDFIKLNLKTNNNNFFKIKNINDLNINDL